MAAKYITISKAASLVGEKVFILKQWEEEYSDLISIKRDDKNARLFTAENIEFFQKVKAFKDSNMDTQTIKQLLQNQRTTSTSSVQEGNDATELQETLSKITSFIESQEVQNMLKLDERLEKLEKNVVSSVSEKITETAKLQTEVARFEFSDVQDMITSLAVTAEAERASYKEEIEVERELAQKKTDEREERFLTFVREHQYRSERMKQEQKSGLGFLKQILSFAR
ncbi:helix-turn-helix domain-containing protein [Metabacillus endolithicus]|uniref:Helix-turn-helix domain-containing protein n=1 Tax=Metabacillus endolithicus TaxID=1535204 RepID=A0ABW5BWM7_9BACI|nr:helix-turn-helix domain-containing protein [Metabacillus endolithicus]UPG64476.1 helix-turn-helix domain-containing protein [Metabacillus endolithicus]